VSDPKDLREVVARLCQCSPESVRDDFSLDIAALRGSMKKAVLIAAIRRYLGVDCMEAATARTFGELQGLVSGKAQAPASASPPAPAGISRPEPVAAAPLAGPACGIDMESVAQLPQTSDYAGHEFYRRSFSAEEIAYCSRQANPRPHFAARWCAKEALKKCDAFFANAPAAELGLVRTASGVPRLRYRGMILPHAVSVTHTEDVAAAVVIAPAATRISSAAIMAMALAGLGLVAAALFVALR